MARSQRRRAGRSRRASANAGGTGGSGTTGGGGGGVTTTAAPPPPSPAPIPRAQPRRGRNPFGFLKRLEPRFIADIVSELRKVTWPSFAETRYLTFVVAVVAIAMGILLGSADLLFGWIIEQLFFN
jgi:preprotein translocase subunit SecE